MVTEDGKPLEPLTKVVSGILRLLVAFLLAGFTLSLVNDEVPVWSGADDCLTVDWISGSSNSTKDLFDPREGSQVNSVAQYCAPEPSGYQRLLGVLSEIPGFVVLIGGLTLLSRMLRSAGQDGVYTAQTASRLRLLGWWLLIGSVAAALTQAVSQAALLATLTNKVTTSVGTLPHTFDPPYLALLTALSVLTFARIVRAGVGMREDLEGTV